MTDRRVFGLETEYAVAAVAANGSVWPTQDAGVALVESVAKVTPHLPDSVHSGIFLCNGSRLYLDCGAHPELAGPECQTPTDAVRYVRAGDLIVQRAAADVLQQHRSLADLRVFTSNVDYSGSGATWGTHESYAHRIDPDTVRRWLIPHLVTRIVFAGAGGFNPLSPGLEFTLSPRAHHLRHVVSGETTHERGIVNTRMEALSRRLHRQHLICGERLQSDIALWLMVGTTALVVASAESGGSSGIELSDPVRALGTVTRDVTCREPLPTLTGERVTALDVQRRLLHRVRAHLDRASTPAWAGEVCARWEEVLDRLAQGPPAVARMLDWGIKFAVYRDRVERRGVAWESLPVWSHVADRLEHARRESPAPTPEPSGRVSRADRTLRPAMHALTPMLREHGLTWRHLDRFLDVRAEMLELDSRWGQLGDGGLFAQLERSGVVDHRVPGVDRFEEATLEPPNGGRAGVRGRRIRAFAATGTSATASWDHIIDYDLRRTLDLSDPLVETESWKAPAAARPAVGQREETAVEGSFWDSISRHLTGRRRHASAPRPTDVASEP